MKEVLETDSLNALEEAATMLAQMPKSPERDAKQAKLQKAFNAIVWQYDLPPEALSPEGPLIRALEFIPGISYAPGLVRTAAGEAYLAAKGKSEGAGRRIKDALVPDLPLMEKGPASRSALSVGEYRKLGGDQEAAWNKEPLLPENPYFNPTKGGTLETVAGAVMDPALLLQGLRGLMKKPKGPATLAEAEARLADEIARAKAPRTALSTAQDVLETAIDPAGAVGRGLENSRFRDADIAAVEAGRRPISNIWREGGKKGYTKLGIKRGMDDIVEKRQGNIDRLLKELPQGQELVDRARQSYIQRFGQEAADGINWGNVPDDTLLASIGIKRSRSDLLEPLNSPELAMKERLGPYAEDLPVAKENVLDSYRQADMNDPSFAEDYKEATRVPKKPRLDPRSGDTATKQVPTRRPEFSGDVLDFQERYYSPEELNLIAQGEQKRAQLLNDQFNQPDASTQVLNKTERRGSPMEKRLEADMRADVGGKARDLQHEAVSAIAPEKGVESFQNTKDLAAILKAGPYIYEPLTDLSGNQSSTRMSRLMKNPIGGAALQALEGSTDFAKLAAGKSLNNPWARLMVQPLVRSAIAEEKGDNRMNSPWYNLYRNYQE